MLNLQSSCSFLRRSILALSLSGAIVFAQSVVVSDNTVVAAPVVGTSAAVRGNVFVSTKGAERKAQVRDAIKLQDKIVTKDDSALQILLLDRSTFTVAQNCVMTIDRFVYDPDTSVGAISARVAKGAFRFMSGRIGKDNPTNATVTTPSATIGIRGTFFEGVVGEDAVALAQLGGIDTSSVNLAEASIVILRGPGRNRNTLDNPGIIEISNSAGSIRISKPDYAVFVPAKGVAPIGPFLVTQEMREYLDFFLRSAPNGQGENPLNFNTDSSVASGQDLFELPVELTDDLNEEVQDGITDPAQPQAQDERTEGGSGGCDGSRCDRVYPFDGGIEGDGWYKFDKDAYTKRSAILARKLRALMNNSPDP